MDAVVIAFGLELEEVGLDFVSPVRKLLRLGVNVLLDVVSRVGHLLGDGGINGGGLLLLGAGVGSIDGISDAGGN